MAKQVTMWESVDGSLHETLAKAQKADARHSLESLLAERGVGRGGPWDSDMVADFLCDNATVVAPLLMPLMDEATLRRLLRL